MDIMSTKSIDFKPNFEERNFMQKFCFCEVVVNNNYVQFLFDFV